MSDRLYDLSREYRCSKCGETKPAIAFSRRTRKSGQVSAQANCKACSNARVESWRKSQPPKKAPDWKYDFRFARDVLGYSWDQAAAWVCNAYEEVDEITMASLGRPVDWQPDPYLEGAAS
ncbi:MULTISPECIES: hypothetical protein [Nocardia]|uniref:hypothetical protein n=1 Tax=Nocardia TaxID=1817 RepID=UPI0007A42C41|nr:MULTISPECIES: hypothetical protein [Nocardia]